MATLLPNAVQQFIDANGVPLAGGTVNFYVPNTTTRKDTWSDPGATILNTNPIVLNAAGENPAGGIYGSGAYRQVVYDAAGNLIWDQLTADTAAGGLVWAGTSTGSANAQVVASFSFAQTDGESFSFKAGLTNTSQLTMQIGAGTPIAVLSDTGNGPVACSGGEVVAGNVYTLTYDSARGAFHVDGTRLIPLPVSQGGTGGTTALAARISLETSTFGPSNLGLAASVNASALTISLVGADGNTPSATNPVRVSFRNVTSGTGTPSSITVTSANTFVISSGSTLGFSSGTPGRLWIVAFNNGGTLALGAVNCLSGTSVMALRDGIYSSTAEGGGGAADSAQVIYTTATLNNLALTILGYMEWSSGLVTAGTWAAVPTRIQLLEPGVAKPSEIVQTVSVTTSTSSSNASTTVWATTNLTTTLTPSSTPNLVQAWASGWLGGSNAASANLTARLQRGSTTFGNLGVTQVLQGSVGNSTVSLIGVDAPGAVSAQTYAVYTLTTNATSAASWSIGNVASFMILNEIMA